MLNEYKKKRDFKKTPEPSPRQKPGPDSLSFVIQKHNARQLHYDFRLELDGVLKSWALPHGPSLDPAIKRLAVLVEDHPIDYASFEGTIPQGEYGAGQVIIWDKGTYIPIEDGKGPINEKAQAETFLRSGLEKGKISFYLLGNKLKGSWALVKMQRTKNDWLLIKHKDEFADGGRDILEEDTSVISGLTIEDQKKTGKLRENNINDKITGAVPSPFPSSISPMLATLTQKTFSDSDWLFEPKLDGYRTLAFVRQGKVKLLSRRGMDVSSQYPFVVQSLNKDTKKEFVLDGEIVALDKSGRTCFQCLQNRLNTGYKKSSGSGDIDFLIIYYVFDVLYLNGKDLRGVPLYQRKILLEKTIKPDQHVKIVKYFDKDAEALYEASVDQGLEGIMAKLKNSGYEDGLRSKNWLKIKATLSDEFIICGYTRGSGNRSKTFGALVLGSYNEQGQLIFTGRVGSGFDDNTLTALRKKLDTIKTDLIPLIQKPSLEGQITWVKPEMVAEIKYAERTQDGLLRAPIFLRLRDDKSPAEIRKTDPAPEISTNNNKIKPGTPESSAIKDILAQLANKNEDFNLDIEGNIISLTNLDKPLWPALGSQKEITKRDLLVYLTKVSPNLLPHLKDRPLTLTRFPNGINGEHFYQRHWENPPQFVKTVSLSEHESASQDYLVCDNISTLIWLGQLANIDLHTWFSRIVPGPDLLKSKSASKKGPDYYSYLPDFIVFDIDPYVYSGKEARGEEPELNRQAFKQTCQVALWLKETLTGLSLNSFVKTSGRTGLHVFVPIVREFDFQAVHAASKTISTFMLQKHPLEVTVDWPVAKRTGKIFLDYNQNVRSKTLACLYSPRSSQQASVSTPLSWDEVDKIYPTDFTISNIPERLSKIGDIWSDILEKKKDLGTIVQNSKG